MVESKFRQTIEDRVIQIIPPWALGLTWPSSTKKRIRETKEIEYKLKRKDKDKLRQCPPQALPGLHAGLAAPLVKISVHVEEKNVRSATHSSQPPCIQSAVFCKLCSV